MTFRPLLILGIATMMTIAAPNAGSTTSATNEPISEIDSSLEAIEESTECKTQNAQKCEALLLKHYCKYAGFSQNALRCEDGQRAIVETELNARYSQLLQALKKAAVQTPSWANAPKILVETQRSWVAFREKECAFLAENYNGGTLQGAIHAECLRNEAKRRIEAFDRYRKYYEINK